MISGLVYKWLIYNQLVPLLNVILQMVVKGSSTFNMMVCDAVFLVYFSLI